MSLLESVFKYLIKENNNLIKTIETKEGIEKLTRLLSDSDTERNMDIAVVQSADASPEELILLANCDVEELGEKERLLPKITFFTEVCRIILDTLRLNSRLLYLYNQVAVSLFEFCLRFQCMKEYRRLAETLHAHFYQIQKASKNPEVFNNSKIPYPVRLDDDDALSKLLELRHHQLEFALKMEEWSDAFRTSENIYNLINRKSQKNIKAHLTDFFKHLSSIFWKSENYLFHTYALQNLHQVTK